MSKLLELFCAVFLASTSAYASSSITVEQASGNRAVVKFNTERPTAGKTYEVGQALGEYSARDMYLNLNADFYDHTFGGSTWQSTLAVEPGWNLGPVELGVPVKLGLGNNGNAMSYAGMGLHPQINIFTNLGSTMIPDIHALISYLHQSNVGTLGTSSVIQYGGGLGAKFFVFRSNWMALTLAVDFLFNKSSGTTTKSISVPIGIRAYF